MGPSLFLFCGASLLALFYWAARANCFYHGACSMRKLFCSCSMLHATIMFLMEHGPWETYLCVCVLLNLQVYSVEQRYCANIFCSQTQNLDGIINFLQLLFSYNLARQFHCSIYIESHNVPSNTTHNYNKTTGFCNLIWFHFMDILYCNKQGFTKISQSTILDITQTHI